jgi:hypothetical protein
MPLGQVPFRTTLVRVVCATGAAHLASACTTDPSGDLHSSFIAADDARRIGLEPPDGEPLDLSIGAYFDSTLQTFAGAPAEPLRLPTESEAESTIRGQLKAGEELLEVRIIALPASGNSFTQGVVRDAHATRLIATGPDGHGVDPRALERAEIQAHFDRYGKMSAELYARLQTEDILPVRMILRVPISTPEIPALDTQDPADLAAWITELRVEHATIVADQAKPLAAWLVSEGAENVTVGPVLPILRASVPRTLLERASLHRSPLVQRIEVVDQTVGELYGHAGRRSMGDEQMSGGQCGGPCTGGGLLPVGVWEGLFTSAEIANENDRIGISDSSMHYQFAPKTCNSRVDCLNGWDDTAAGYECVAGKCVVEHTSFVLASMGMFGSYTKNGITYTTAGSPDHQSVYVANEAIGNTALEWLLANPVLYANRSQQLVEYDGIELAARNELLFVTTAAGNSGGTGRACDGDRTDDHYNDLCVGSYAYNEPLTIGDDRRSIFSSYLDRTGGAERPHLLGPGSSSTAGGGLHMPSVRHSNGTMVTLDQFSIPIAGTSFAAPAVLSMAMQTHLYEGIFTDLAHPVVKKAVLLAGTVDANGDGDLLDQTGDSHWGASADGRDGAGRPDTERIEDILDADNYDYIDLRISAMTSCGSNCREYTVATENVPNASHVKVALVYNACIETPAGSATLRNDLDLVLERPPACLNSLISATTNSETEMVHSACVHGGVYTIKVRLKGTAFVSCDSIARELIAVAWSL